MFKNIQQMKQFFWFLAVIFLPVFVQAQFDIRGMVSDSSGTTLPGAHVQVLQRNHGTVTNQDGSFRIGNLKPGRYTLEATFIGYKSARREIILKQDETIHFILEINPLMQDEVIIQATRATDKTPATYINISRDDIEKLNMVKDIPYLVENTPSIVTTSDAGMGVGYTWMSIRGTDITRINVTMNGIPLNDTESQSLWFVDLPDLASSIEQMQIQRGVGTSTNGPAAFGASIN
ncbi:MAG: TonB-dependent receptor, partial [Bacteroidetes bacterium]|nr:TonB-dependent receptor [Bacteroidota bacterium]